MAASAPSFRQAAHFSALPAVAITVAPKALASWIAVVPMPDVPPWTSSVSPAVSRPRSKRFGQTVKKVSGIAAASTIERPSGTGRALVSCTDAVFGIAAAGEERGHRVADAKARRAGAERRHLAGDLQPGNVGRSAGRRRVTAEPLQHVRPVDAGGPHADQDRGSSRGTGSGRWTTTSLSRPPGSVMATAVMVAGRVGMAGSAG